MQTLGYTEGDPNGSYQTVIAAPGVPLTHPDLVTLRGKGAEVIGELVLTRRLRPALPIVGVTGTAGKGGTTVLIADLLRACGVAALEGGNIDPPLLDVVDKAEVAVAELSSFQLERSADLRLPVAVVTNLGVDHLDRHGTVADYHAAKVQITSGQGPQDVLIVPVGFNHPTKARVLTFRPDALVLSTGQEVLGVSELPTGIHPANAAAALLACEAMLNHLGKAVEVPVLAQALRDTKPVAGRFEIVAQHGGLTFIDDSIATRTIAVQAALERAKPPIAWLVGGIDKGAELEPLRQAAQGKVKQVIAFGQDGPALAKRLGFPTTVIIGDDGDEVMGRAIQAAAEALGGQGTVLLAPIGTSFDLYKDYKARGHSFKQAATRLGDGS